VVVFVRKKAGAPAAVHCHIFYGRKNRTIAKREGKKHSRAQSASCPELVAKRKRGSAHGDFLTFTFPSQEGNLAGQWGEGGKKNHHTTRSTGYPPRILSSEKNGVRKRGRGREEGRIMVLPPYTAPRPPSFTKKGERNHHSSIPFFIILRSGGTTASEMRGEGREGKGILADAGEIGKGKDRFITSNWVEKKEKKGKGGEERGGVHECPRFLIPSLRKSLDEAPGIITGWENGPSFLGGSEKEQPCFFL